MRSILATAVEVATTQLPATSHAPPVAATFAASLPDATVVVALIGVVSGPDPTSLTVHDTDTFEALQAVEGVAHEYVGGARSTLM